MALRRNIRRRKPTLVGKILKLLLLLLTLVALAVGGFIFYFNGQHVKDPLLSLLNERTGASFSAEKVEFSPIYPDVLKLENVGINKGHIDSLYIEYDLKTLLSGQKLVIRELYARGVKLYPQDFATLVSNKLGFESLNFQTIRLENLDIHSTTLTAKDVSLKLNNTDITKDGNILAQDGSISFSEGSVDGHFIKDLSSELFFKGPHTLLLRKLEASLLGGKIAGEVEINLTDRAFDFSRLSASNLVLKEPQNILGRYSIKVREADLSKIVVVFNQDDLLLSGISGKMENLSLGNTPISGIFKGAIEEISLPERQITLENNHIMADISESTRNFSLDGTFLEGHYSIQGEHQPKDNLLKINSLMLTDQKIELDDALYSLLKNTVLSNSLVMHNATFSHLSFLSKRVGLPLSIKDISGSLDGLMLSKDGSLTAAPAALLELKLLGLLYSDFGISKINLISSYSDNLINLSVPELKLRNSTLNLGASYNIQTGQGYLLSQGRNFELSELNSNLIPHLFGGRMDLDVDLKTTLPLEKLPQSVQGHISVQGKNIIVSSIGLDLINGGPKDNYHLDGSAFLEALKQGDSGISDLNLDLHCNGTEGKLTGSLELATSSVTIASRINLENLQLSGKSFLISLPKDSVTSVEVGGTLTSPEFKIEAVTRGEPRPGLFVTGEQTKTLFLQHQEEKRKKEELSTLLENIAESADRLYEEHLRMEEQAQQQAEVSSSAAEASSNKESQAAETAGKKKPSAQQEVHDTPADPLDALEADILNTL